MRTLSLMTAGVVALSMALPVLAQEDHTAVSVEPTQQVQQIQQIQQIQQMHALGKRPYQAIVAQRDQADQAWVGATLRLDGPDVHQPMKLHQLGKRGF